MFGRRRGKQERPAPQWSREKMLALLVGAGLGCVLLVAGLVLFVVHEVSPSRAGGKHSAAGGGTHAAGSGRTGPGGSSAASDPRDVLAAKAMTSVGDDASHPSAVSTVNPGVDRASLPPRRPGPAQVPTGFPHTPAGAMAQLAAIDQVALQSGSLADARAVIDSWAMPGGPTSSSWSLLARRWPPCSTSSASPAAAPASSRSC